MDDQPDTRTLMGTLKACPSFSRLDTRTLGMILNYCHVMDYTPDVPIPAPGARRYECYVVIAGQVELLETAWGHGRPRVINPGEAFGEAQMWARVPFDDPIYPVEGTRLLVIPRKAAMRAIESGPEAVASMLAGALARLYEHGSRRNRYWRQSIPSRLAELLMDLSQQADGRAFRLPQTKCSTAWRLATTPETLSRSLAAFHRGGLIHMQGRHITILDRPNLERVARLG